MKLTHFVSLVAVPFATFADQRGDTPGSQPSTPQEQLKKFHVPPGFEVQLVAAEPEIQKPINLNFDAAGRLWVTGSELYPWPASTDANGEPIPDFDKGWRGIIDGFRVGDQAPQPPAEGRDSVRVLGDFDATGHARKITIFADKLNIPSGIQPLPRGTPAVREVYGLRSAFDQNPEMQKRAPIADRHIGRKPKGDSAVVYSIPNIWLMTDWDGDGFAESRIPLYTGFGYTDTHGGSSSYIYWIDGWIYGTHGFRNHSEVRDRNGRVTVLDSGNTFRFRPDGAAFEIYAHGQTNPFGLAFDPLGNLFSADSHSKPVYMLLRGGYYEGIGKQHDGLGFAPRITDDDHGSSAIAGIACYADDKWPEGYRGNLFNGNPVTQRINRDRLEWHGATPKAIRMPDFLTCDDPWFRPVNLKLGPDGALYIADFYNPIIGHYEVPLTHPARDHTHGRVWRVVYRGENASASREAGAPGSTRVPPSRTSEAGVKPDSHSAAGTAAEVPPGEAPRPTRGSLAHPGVPNLTRLDAAGLVEKLADPSLEVRRLATNELVEKWRGEDSPSILAIFDAASSTAKSLGLWVLQRVGIWTGREVNASRSLNPSERLASIRIITQRAEAHGIDEISPDQRRQETRTMISAAMADAVPDIRLAGVQAASRFPLTEQLGKLLNLAKETPAEDVELQYAIRAAIRDHLASDDGYVEAAKALSADPSGAEILAGASLAIKTPEASGFLLAHLARTHFMTPRAAEYLRHAALHVPAEKFDAVVKLVDEVGEIALHERLAIGGALSQAAGQRGIALPEKTAAWAQRAMLEALASGDPALERRAINAVRDATFDAKLNPLSKIARDARRDGALRLAALDAAANLPASRHLLSAILAEQKNMALSRRAAELLAANGGADVALAALPNAPWDLALSIAGALSKSDAGATALLDAIDAGRTSPRVLVNLAVAWGFSSRPKPLQDRAVALTKGLPPEDARLDKVIAERAKLFRTKPANAGNGAAVFQRNCAVCHRFRNASQSSVGPNLDGIAARSPQRLIEDILDPNRNVDPAFRQTIIETRDGRTLAGANVREQDAAIVLTDATGKDASIPKAAIKTRTSSPLSLMPPIFETQLPPDELNDLVAFLLAPASL